MQSENIYRYLDFFSERHPSALCNLSLKGLKIPSLPYYGYLPVSYTHKCHTNDDTLEGTLFYKLNYNYETTSHNENGKRHCLGGS